MRDVNSLGIRYYLERCENKGVSATGVYVAIQKGYKNVYDAECSQSRLSFPPARSFSIIMAKNIKRNNSGGREKNEKIYPKP